MERLTKLVIALWVSCAITYQTTLLMGSWPNLPWLTLGAALGAAVAVFIDRRLIAALFLFPYVFQTLVWLAHGNEYSLFRVLWMGALFGAILPDVVRTSWHIPRRWRAPLVFAALVVVTSSVIVIWREIDGAAYIFGGLYPTYWRGADPSSFPIRWVLDVSLVLVIGILWFDWLCGAEGFNLERWVVTPLVFSSIATATMSAYQYFLDIRFLNGNVFGNLGRATGAMFDANAAGMVAALWVGGTVLWAWRLRGWTLYVAPVSVALNLLAVWASGSRTALVVGACGAMASLLAIALQDARLRLGRLAVAFGIAACLVGLVTRFGSANPNVDNAGSRAMAIVRLMPTPSLFFQTMWRRNGYGTAAVKMIQQSPLAGVGVGSYHGLVTGIGASFGRRLTPDNAQNWLRHQIAEFGLIGGLGWVVWFFSFAAFVLVPRRDESPGTWIARGILAAFGFVSLVGMAGQDTMVAFTFWTFAFWYVSLAGKPQPGGRLNPWIWSAMAVLLIVFAVQASSIAATTLRVPERMRRIDLPFSYGYDAPQPPGPLEGFRRTMPRAVALVETKSAYLAVTVRLQDTAVASGPVDVRVWREGEIVLKAQLSGTTPVTGFVPVDTSAHLVLIEGSARPVRASWFRPFTDDPGVLTKWEFVDGVPPQYHHYSSGSTESR